MKGMAALFLAIILGPLYAVESDGPCGVHTWHDVVSKSGAWKITLKMISQNGQFVDRSCSTVSQTTISPNHELVYGFGFVRDADFNLAYTLTAISEETGFQSKACVFVVTANGPAQPDIHVISYHGAECQWNVVRGVGENFSVN